MVFSFYIENGVRFKWEHFKSMNVFDGVMPSNIWIDAE